MKYNCGTEVMLGDILLTSHGENLESETRVVGIGTQSFSPSIDSQFIQWAIGDNLIKDNTVIIEWVGENPYAHNDLKFAPVGNQVFLDDVSHEKF